jgi:hypothetical protein
MLAATITYYYYAPAGKKKKQKPNPAPIKNGLDVAVKIISTLEGTYFQSSG